MHSTLRNRISLVCLVVALFCLFACYPHRGLDGNHRSSAIQAHDDRDHQVEITELTPLLKSDGTLLARGWARTPLMQYNPKAIPKDLRPRKKEWEHYTIVSPDFAFTITAADIRFATFVAFEVIDFATGKIESGISIVSGSRGKFPRTPFGEVAFVNGKTSIRMQYEEGMRTIDAHMAATFLSPEMDCRLTLTAKSPDENVAAAAPFAQKGTFFYENKIFGMPVAGYAVIDGKRYEFDPQKFIGILDWGRGVWPHATEWHWGFAAGYKDGGIIGFNIGDGLSDDSLGTANALKYHGRIHKFYRVDFDYDPEDLMKPWKITGDGGRLVATFTPFYHQRGGAIVLDIGLLLDKMYGTFSGTMILDDGTKVAFEKLLGFIEHSVQKW